MPKHPARLPIRLALLALLAPSAPVPMVSAAAQARTGQGLHAVAISAGRSFALALDADGAAYAWGNNDWGQLGGGTAGGSFGLSPSPVVVPAGAPPGFRFIAVSVGDSSRLALGSDGAIYAWDSQHARGGVTLAPVPSPAGAPAGFRFTAIAAGEDHTLALGSDGNVYAWGTNTTGQLGDGTATSRETPGPVRRPAGTPAAFRFTAIAAGSHHGLALGSDGRVYAWGENAACGQSSGLENSSVPVAIQQPAGAAAGVHFTAVAAGEDVSLALGSDGLAYSWGFGDHGTLGNGLADSSCRPLRVSLPAGASVGFGFTAVSANVFTGYAVGSDGVLYGWGANDNGQLGDGSKIDRRVPTTVGPGHAQPPPAAVLPATPGPAGALFFRQTRHNLAGAFLAFWQRYGGLGVFGYPLTEPFTDDGQTIQYTERFVLALTGGVVTTLPLGALLSAGRQYGTVGPPAADAAGRYFPATGHSLSGRFLTYWQTRHGALLLGAPVSEMITEQNGDGTGRSYLLQWFERGRLEYHPELQDPRYLVEGGQLGRLALRARGWLP